MPPKTTTQEATSYLNQLGYSAPDAGEVAGAQENMDSVSQGIADVSNKVSGLIASSKQARSEYNQNNIKLDGKIRNLSTNYGITDATGKPMNDINAEGAEAGAGFKFAYGPDGSKVQIPQGASPEQYGMSATPPANKGIGPTGDTQTKPEATDPYAKALGDYSSRIASQEAESKKFFSDFATRQEETTRAMIDSIQKKYEARRLKMEDINARYLEGSRIAGISSGRQRYAPTMQQGLLSTEEMDGQARLAEIDAEELSLIAQAKQARDEMSYKVFNDSMSRLDTVNKEKLDVITKLHNASIEQDKILEEKRKSAFEEQQTLQNTSLKMADSLASSVYKGLNSLKSEKDKEAYMETIAKKYGIDTEVLRSSAIEYGQKASREELEQANIRSQMAARTDDKKKATQAEVKTNAISSINYLLTPEAQANVVKSGGIPYVDKNGYLTPTGFKTLIAAAKEAGIDRKEFLAEYGSQLYLEEGKASVYGLTAKEAKDLSSGASTGSTITRDVLQNAFELSTKDAEALLVKAKALAKTGMSDEEIIKQLTPKE